jgi:7-cyano-7-deazaguanine synthase
MSIVTLVSGGLDSSLMSLLAYEEGLELFPLYIDYGQICKTKELEACLRFHTKYGLPKPEIMNLNGFGKTVPSGLTNPNLDIKEEAFLPGRNLMFLVAGSAYAYHRKADAVAIGLLSEKYSLFPDQTLGFINTAENVMRVALGRNIKILTPLIQFTKKNVIDLAGKKGISNTYSCHSGTDKHCGKCISCLEIGNAI